MESTKIMYKTFPIDELTVHSKHNLIYNDISEDDFLPELEELIVEHGIKTPLIVNENGTIISGYRRYEVLKKIGQSKVRCKVQRYNNSYEELWDLVLRNLNRNSKTRTQKIREGMVLFDILKNYGKEILINELKYKQRITSKIDLSNETRYIVAQILGIEGGEKSNGKVFSMAKSALEKADEYKKIGNDVFYNMIIIQLNKVSSKAAYSLAYKVDIEKLNNVDKKGLLNGQIKGNSITLPLKHDLKEEINKYNQVIKTISEQKDTKNTVKLEEIVNEYNAKSRGEIEIIIPEKENGYISKTLEKAMINFRNDVAQCMTHQKDINNLSEEERKRLNRVMTKFIEDFQKDKNIITGGL